VNTQILFGIAVVPAIVGLVEVCKDLGVPTRVSPALAVCFGILAGLAELYAGQWPWIQAVVLGISLGLSACGLYSGAKTVVDRVTENVPLQEVDPKGYPSSPAPAVPTPTDGRRSGTP
jgi:hypothetical protein